MKKYFVFLLAFSTAACSGQPAEKSGENIQAAAATPETVTSKSNGEAVGCGQMLFFKKGLKIVAGTFQGDGTVTRKDQTTIKDVYTEGGVTIAKAEAVEVTDGKEPGKPIEYTYKCDGHSFYVDISNMMGAISRPGAKMSVSELAFPIDIKEGQELPEASIAMEMETRGKTMQTKVTYKDRKVEGKETLTIGSRSYSCLKVSAFLETEMVGLDAESKKVMDAMKARQPKMKSVMWYAPDAGVLRFDLYMGDQLRNYSQVIEIK